MRSPNYTTCEAMSSEDSLGLEALQRAEDAHELELGVFHLSPDLVPGLAPLDAAANPALQRGGSPAGGAAGGGGSASLADDDDSREEQDLSSFLRELKQKYGLLDLAHSQAAAKAGWLVSHPLNGGMPSPPSPASQCVGGSLAVPLPAARLQSEWLPATAATHQRHQHKATLPATLPCSGSMLAAGAPPLAPTCLPSDTTAARCTQVHDNPTFELLPTDGCKGDLESSATPVSIFMEPGLQAQRVPSGSMPAGQRADQAGVEAEQVHSVTAVQGSTHAIAQPSGAAQHSKGLRAAEGPADASPASREGLDTGSSSLPPTKASQEADEEEDAISHLLQMEQLQHERDQLSCDTDGEDDSTSSTSCSRPSTAAAPACADSPEATCSKCTSMPGAGCSSSSSAGLLSGFPDPGGIPAHRPVASQPWQALNDALVRAGFPPVLPCPGSGPSETGALALDAALTYQALSSLLREHARLCAHVQRLSQGVQGASRREAQAEASFVAISRQKDVELQKWKRLALENQQLARDVQLAGAVSTKGAQALAAEARHLAGQVQQLQHELRSKDGEAEKLRQRAAAQLERDERRAKADREAYERLKRAWAASKAAETPAQAERTVTAAVKELRPVDICRIFEAERSNLQEELAVTRAERQVLEGQLQRAKEALHRAGLPTEGAELLEGQARAAARQAASAEERAAQLAEETVALRQELAARPTAAQLESLQRQVEIMSRQLQKAAAEKAAANAKATSESKPRPRQLSTRELIQRDRGLKRLGLYCVEELPKPVLVEVLQDACLLLECTEPLKLCQAISPVQDLAALVPRMERWIGDVCAAVFQSGKAHVPEALCQDNPADVPAILRAWIAELSELLEARGILRALTRQLASRAGLRPGQPPPTAAEVVPLVAQLVELERASLHSAEVIQAAEAALAAQPEVLINRIVNHFRQLFGCTSLEGVLPAMNKVYAAHSEAQTFLASLRTALGLQQGATLEACANRLQQLVEDKRELLATMLPAKEPHVASGRVPDAQHVKVVEVAPRRRELQAAADTVIDRLAEARNFPTVEIYVTQRQSAQQQ